MDLSRIEMLRAINGGDRNLWNACPIPQKVRMPRKRRKPTVRDDEAIAALVDAPGKLVDK